MCDGVGVVADAEEERCICAEGYELGDDNDVCESTATGLPGWAIALIVVGSVLVAGGITVAALMYFGVISFGGSGATSAQVNVGAPIQNESVFASGKNSP